MRRALLTTALVLAALAGPATAAAAPASVKLARCSFAEHEAVFHARMHRVVGAERMALRFTLLERSGGAEFEAVKAPGLRRWRWSRDGVREFGYRQGLRNLPENATHRVRVDFRWYAADGTLVERARRRSAPCRQFVALPNLVAEMTAVHATEVPGVVRYEAHVTNNGRAPALAVPVRLTVDGDVVDTVRIAAIEPGESRSVSIRGPDCRELAQVEVDPDAVIAESREDDNAHRLACG